MSYCRFSSMNWACDVYVYENCGGRWTTHVAGNRRMFQPIPDILDGRLSVAVSRWSGGYWDKAARKMAYPQRWRGVLAGWWFALVSFWHERIHMASLRAIPLRPIGLQFDGETFSDNTPTECAARLEWLRGLGYTVPQHAIDALRSEVVAE